MGSEWGNWGLFSLMLVPFPQHKTVPATAPYHKRPMGIGKAIGDACRHQLPYVCMNPFM